MSKSKLYSSDKIIEEFYKALADKNESKVRRVHIPRSDVFYIRVNFQAEAGIRDSLDRVERAMYLEGHLSRYDVLDPDRKRKWEE